MLNRLSELREKRQRDEDGFTLIELLVVVVIIGILIAIAIPLYLNYKKGANDKSAQSDLRGGISALEQCMSDNGTYPTALAADGSLTGCTGGKLTKSSGTTLIYFVKADGTAYTLAAYNSGGNASASNPYCYASYTGGSVKQATAAVAAYGDTCP